MTMNLFLIQLAANLLTQTLPLSLGIYFAIRFAISHGGLQLRKPDKRKEE